MDNWDHPSWGRKLRQGALVVSCLASSGILHGATMPHNIPTNAWPNNSAKMGHRKLLPKRMGKSMIPIASLYSRAHLQMKALILQTFTYQKVLAGLNPELFCLFSKVLNYSWIHTIFWRFILQLNINTIPKCWDLFKQAHGKFVMLSLWLVPNVATFCINETPDVH